MVLLSDFFASVDLFTREDVSNAAGPMDKKYTAPLSTIALLSKQVLDKLNYLSKSPGVDDLYPRVLGELAAKLADPFTVIYKLSLKIGVVPWEWKEVNITPIFKKDPKRKVEKYRPISLTSVVCKILESFITQELHKHMFSNLLFTQAQHGFMNGGSCVTQLLK